MHTYIHIDLVAYIVSLISYSSWIVAISVAAVLACAITGVVVEISGVIAAVLAFILIADAFAWNITTSPWHPTFDCALHQTAFIRTASVITQLLGLSLTAIITALAKCNLSFFVTCHACIVAQRKLLHMIRHLCHVMSIMRLTTSLINAANNASKSVVPLLTCCIKLVVDPL